MLAAPATALPSSLAGAAFYLKGSELTLRVIIGGPPCIQPKSIFGGNSPVV